MINNHFIKHFLTAAQHYADKPALYFNKEIYDYQTINRLSDDVAKIISKFALPKETIIPLVLERTPQIIITMIGILKAGCAFLPISPSSPCSRIEYILEETKSKIVFCDLSFSFSIPNETELINPNTLTETDSSNFTTVYESAELAYVMYTSGSTGKPKGVMIEHRSMMNLFSSLTEILSLSNNDLFLALTDYTFDISLIELLMPLTIGASIVLTEHGAVADGKKIKQYLNNFDISFMQATPLTWEILLKNGWKNKGLTRLLVGGEQFKTSLALKLEYKKGNVWNVYGPTETSMWSMIYPLQGDIPTESVPLGNPIANTHLKLIYEEDSTKAELYIGGLGVARGYLNSAELTQSKFIIDNKDTIRYYKTGDLVSSQEGLLCYAGRIDNQLKFGGIRIESGEIEATIEQEAFVKKAVVKIHEHNEYYKTMAAYVEIDEEALFAHGIHVMNEDSSHYLEKIYDETYSHANEFDYQTINTCGWQSSFTGLTFPEEELLESYEQIKKYIRHSNLEHVLEIGCGTGFLLLDYLPYAQNITVMEISQKAIDYVKKLIPKTTKNKITFKLKSMVNLHEVSRFSCIIVNSVVQYLPSIKSLVDSLKQLIKATKTGGSILIGDVRSLELLDIYLAIKNSRHHPSDMETCPPNLFYKSRDSEIVLSPLFFYALKQQFKRISWVDINIKHGQYPNELNYFRYDVILHIEKPVKETDCHTISFNTIDNLSDLIKEMQQPLLIQNIPYNYFPFLCTRLSLQTNKYVHHLLKMTHHNDDKLDKEKALSMINGTIDKWEHFIQYQSAAPQQYLQMLLTPISQEAYLIRPIQKERYDSIHSYCREPFSPWLQKFCFEHIKIQVKKHIMSWVNPSIYVWVEQWPQTINGKLDRKQLQLPATYHPEKDKGSILSQLKHIWLNITGDHALIREEFWTHGVSSLSMYFFLATINETFHLHLTYHEFHQYNTMEKVSARIEHLLKISDKKDIDEGGFNGQ